MTDTTKPAMSETSTGQQPTAAELAAELSAATCRCGLSKARAITFCARCYFRLPKDIRRKLYRLMGQGYEEARQAAEEYLLVLEEKQR